jgi:hypothetical protein
MSRQLIPIKLPALIKSKGQKESAIAALSLTSKPAQGNNEG